MSTTEYPEVIDLATGYVPPKWDECMGEGCTALLVPNRVWAAMPLNERREATAEGYARGTSSSRCNRCSRGERHQSDPEFRARMAAKNRALRARHKTARLMAA